MTTIIICHKEELQLLSWWLRKILFTHCYDSYENPSENNIVIDMRKKVQGYETDMILTCKSGSRTVRIGFELKESDLYKAVSQAVERRALFHYFYIVLNLHAHQILTLLKGHAGTEKALSIGVGFISSTDDCIVIKSYSKPNWRESESYSYTILAYLKGDGEIDNKQ